MLSVIRQAFGHTAYTAADILLNDRSNDENICKLDWKVMEKKLVAFDFDHTIIDSNSDTYVIGLSPGGQIPDSVRQLYACDGWTVYMAAVFKYLHSNKVTSEQILDCVAEIPFTPGMRELLWKLDRDHGEVIIISDSNSVFINHILEVGGVRRTVRKVFTNPAMFDSRGCLCLEMYHLQDWCALSTKNLCKGHILQEYIKEREAEGVKFSQVAFVGDGKNDFCPSLRLTGEDLVFPRRGYVLPTYIQEMEKQGRKLQARVFSWETGFDIIDVLKKYPPLHK